MSCIAIEKIHKMSYASVSGILGGFTISFLKLAMELLFDDFPGFFVTVSSYFVLLSLVVTLYLQVYFLNTGLARWGAEENIPVLIFTNILSGSVGGAIVSYTVVEWWSCGCY